MSDERTRDSMTAETSRAPHDMRSLSPARSSCSSTQSRPVLIHSTSSAPSPTQPTLTIPYALPLVSFLDAAHSGYGWKSTSTLITTIAVVRNLIVGLGVGLNRRWRGMGGWVVAAAVLSMGAIIWESCAGQMTGDGPITPTATLVTNSVFAIAEYLTFLILLRLSPPASRIHPLSVRVSSHDIQSPTGFSLEATEDEDEDDDDLVSDLPASPRRRFSPTHMRHASQHTFMSVRSVEPDEADDPDFSDTSSISESSIIDLPPPQSPNRIIPPSMSITSGLSIAATALEDSPVIGPLVRRTRSARYLNMVRAEEGDPAVGRSVSMAEGYGTFRG